MRTITRVNEDRAEPEGERRTVQRSKREAGAITRVALKEVGCVQTWLDDQRAAGVLGAPFRTVHLLQQQTPRPYLILVMCFYCNQRLHS